MKELVFSIKNVFDSNSPDGCLTQYKSTCFHIPAYQRGYKWGSEAGGAVSILLDDLWSAFKAFKRQGKKEYYLQYITVKPGSVDVQGSLQECLEVIDGQQRLTTLSILVSALAALLATNNSSAEKLHYAIRDVFFAKYIYNSADFEEFVGRKWDDLKAFEETNKQDIYYLHAAAGKIYQFLQQKQQEPTESATVLNDFAAYLFEHVKLIVNSVEAHVLSETVFKNLNSNKVPLTEAELIKALVITKVGRTSAKAARKGFKEVMETRLHLGRLWDEISRWANTPEISTFYFNGHPDGMRQFLELIALYLGAKKDDLTASPQSNKLLLFNFYSQHSDISQAYTAIKDGYALLSDWYANPALYNLLGFCRFVKNSKYNKLSFLKDCLKCPTKSALKDLLNKAKTDLLPKSERIKELRYGQDDAYIHAVLLYLSVFPKGQEKSGVRFNFHEFLIKNWSLEHIFPQSPEGKAAQLDTRQIADIKGMLGDSPGDNVLQLLDKEQRSDDEKNVYYEKLRSGPYLNSIGNMCLLTSSDNASNGCLFFREKRPNMLKLIRQGSFVPKHTFDVFSKMMESLVNNEPNTWTVTDIAAHEKYIVESINQ